jgi:hypothetical protein
VEAAPTRATSANPSQPDAILTTTRDKNPDGHRDDHDRERSALTRPSSLSSSKTIRPGDAVWRNRSVPGQDCNGKCQLKATIRTRLCPGRRFHLPTTYFPAPLNRRSVPRWRSGEGRRSPCRGRCVPLHLLVTTVDIGDGCVTYDVAGDGDTAVADRQPAHRLPGAGVPPGPSTSRLRQRGGVRHVDDRLSTFTPHGASAQTGRRKSITRCANSSGTRSIAMCCWPSRMLTRASGSAAATVS